MYTEQIKTLASKLENKYINVRRHLHQYPETAFNEYTTAEYIKARLLELGLEVRTGFAKTAVLGFLKGSKPGKTIAIRADMDALNIKEENTFDFISKNEGVMHACGHDIHMSVVLGAAELLSNLKEQISGNIVFIFQPGEEGYGGAKLVVDAGIIEEYGIETIIAEHVSPLLPVGRISIRNGPAMASQSEFNIIIKGRGGHAAQPHTAADPIIAGVNIVNMLQALITREKNPVDSAVLSVTCFNAGNTFNVIPDKAEIRGTVRSFSTEVDRTIDRRMHEICSCVCTALGVECDVTYISGYPPVVNSEDVVNLIVNSARKHIDKDDVITGIDPVMLSEDFAYYAQVIPGAMYNLGCREPDATTAWNLHNPRFNPDESCIVKGIEIMSQCALDFLNQV